MICDINAANFGVLVTIDTLMCKTFNQIHRIDALWSLREIGVSSFTYRTLITDTCCYTDFASSGTGMASYQFIKAIL